MMRGVKSAIILVGLAIPGVVWAQGPTVSIEFEYLATIEVPRDPPQPVGARLIINVPAGGTVHGPKINGTVVPPSGDWLIRMPDGSSRLDVRATIKTDDGEFILIAFSGVTVASKEVMDRYNKGEVVTFEYWVVAPQFTTASKKYEWLNHIQAVGKMVSIQKGKLKFDLFAVR